jgi:4-hydroxybenzoate polyprenyltransferase
VTARDLVSLLRPFQWSKNGIVLAGLVFSRHLLQADYALRTAAAFATFCLASSAIYALNDVIDVERDRLHPMKRDRPVASGRIRRPTALALSGILAAAALAVGTGLGPPFLITLCVFLILNTSYSLTFKHVVILDVMLIAMSFVVRAIAGVMALRPLDAGIELSPWLLVCTLFLALFLGLGKRRHELNLLEANAGGHRSTLSEYSPAFLDQLIAIVTSATIIGYAIYTIAPGTVSRYHSPALVYTIPFVTFGVFRYLYLIQIRQGGGNPSRTLYRDLPILLTTLGWLVTVVLVVYA